MASTLAAPTSQDPAAWSRGCSDPPAPPGLGVSAAVATLILNLLSLALPIVILHVYDRVLPNFAFQTLSLLAFGLCTALLCDAAIRLARAHLTAWSAVRYEHLLGCSAMDRLLGADLVAFERDAPGVHLEHLNAIDTLRDYYAGQSRLLLWDLPFVGLFLGLMAFIAGPLVALPVLLLGVVAGTALVVGRRLRQALQNNAKLDQRRHAFIIEVLQGIETVKLMAMEPLMQRRYERLQEAGARSTYRVTFLSNLAQNIGSFFSYVTMVAVAGVGALMVVDGQLSIGGLAASTLLSGRSIQPLLRALGLWAQFQGIRVARAHIQSIFRLQPEAAAGRPEMDAISGAFELRAVTGTGSRADAATLPDVALAVQAGDCVAITGDSGSGKTTLLMTLMNAIPPGPGRLYFDGVDAAQRDPASLRRQIAYLPQHPVLFRGSLLDNLTGFRGPDAVQAALAAAESLGLDDVIRRLPDGYATQVGDGAEASLTLGVRQCIGIARALAAPHKLVLFDDANSAFDEAANAALLDLLGGLRGKTTTVLVSHRPSMLVLADRVLELRDGRLRPWQGGARPAGDAAPGRPGTAGPAGQTAS